MNIQIKEESNFLIVEASPEPLSDIVIDFLMEKSRETAELDFKYIFNISKKSDFATIVKDIFAFSNYGGGHILFGFFEKETGSYEARGLPANFHVDQADLQQTFNSYSSDPITLGYREFERKIDGERKKFAIIYIPPSYKILKAIKTGTYKDNKGKTHIVFSKGDIFYRRGTQSIKASYEEIKYIEKRVTEKLKEIALLSGEPDNINENLYSNLFLMKNMPNNTYYFKVNDENIFNAKVLTSNVSYYKSGDIIYTFYDKIKDLLKDNIIESSYNIEDINNFIKNGKENIITALMNKEILIHNKKIGLNNDWRDRQTFFFPTDKHELRKSWQSRYKKSTRLVAQRIYISQLERALFWHLAADMRFFKIGENYVFNILPKIILTNDGYNVIHGFKEGRVITSLSYNEFNNKFLNHILFWRYQINPDHNDTFSFNNRIVVDNEPISINLLFGIKSDRPSQEFKDRKSELYFIEEEIE